MMMMMMMMMMMLNAGVAGRVTVSLQNASVPAGQHFAINCSSQRETYWNFVPTNATSTVPLLICYHGMSISVNRRKYGCQKTSDGEWPVVIRNFGQSDVGLYTCSDDGRDRDSSFLSLACKLFLLVQINIIIDQLWLVAWYSGRTLVFDRRTFPVLRSTCS